MNANAKPDRMAGWLLSLALLGVMSCAGGEVYGTHTYVAVPPPPPRVEVVEVAPGPQYVWIEGQWAWTGQNYVWETGRWLIPTDGHHGWHRGRWKHAQQGWYWEDGHWR